MSAVHVEPVRGGWSVKRGSEPARSFSTKAEAMEVGRQLAHANRAERVVHRRDGRIEERDSFSHDPFPPRRSQSE